MVLVMETEQRWGQGSILAALATLVGCDHVTKFAAKAELENHAPRQLIASLLDLQYVQNTDVAFNLLRWIPERVRAPLLMALGVLALPALGVAVMRKPVRGAKGAAFLLILAGALGNYADRLFRGYVVDFIHVSHWPVFNVADVLVTVGVALLCWTSLRERQTPHAA